MYAFRFVSACALLLAGGLFTSSAQAGHTDILIYSDGAPSPTLLSGALDFEDGDSFADIRMFEGFLEPASFSGQNFYEGDEPGANAVTVASGSLPSGASALSAGDIFFDVAGLTIDGSTGELFLWDDLSGVFNLAPSAYSLELQGLGAVADGSSTNNVSSTRWAAVDANGFFHQHRDYQLLDNDANTSTVAQTGVYLFSLTARMAGFNDSLPMYMVIGAGLDEESEADEELLERAADHVGDTFGVMAAEIEEPVIPEPGAMAIWALGASALLARRNRR